MLVIQDRQANSEYESLRHCKNMVNDLYERGKIGYTAYIAEMGKLEQKQIDIVKMHGKFK